MATVWITYAWEDNRDGDVDFLAQELQALGLQVKLDRWSIQAGTRLWFQIERFIQNDAESDAWVLYATQQSLSSEPCREEYAYALDRALSTRGSTFPVIALFSGPVEPSLIPAGIRTRLYLSTSDPDWKERIVAAAERRIPDVSRTIVQPYSLKVHPVEGGYVIEVRPRAGVWFPFSFAVPERENEKVGGHRPVFFFDTPGQPPPPPECLIQQWDKIGSITLADGNTWWVLEPSEEVTPAKSFFIFAREVPSAIAFGPRGKGRLFEAKLPI